MPVFTDENVMAENFQQDNQQNENSAAENEVVEVEQVDEVAEKNNIPVMKQKSENVEAEFAEREKNLQELENKLQEKSAELSEREKNIAEVEKKSAELAELAKKIDAKEIELGDKEKSLQEQADALENLRLTLSRREQEMQTELIKQRESEVEILRQNLNEVRTRTLTELTADVEKMRNNCSAEIARRRAELETEIDLRLKKADEEIKQRRENCEVEIKNLRQQAETELQNCRNDLNKFEQSLNYERGNLETEKKSVEFDKLRLKKLEDTLKNRQANIDAEVAKLIEEAQQNFEVRLQAIQDDNKKLREELKTDEVKIASYESFRSVYGDNPEILQKKFADLQTTCDELKKELGLRPGPELQQSYSQLKEQFNNLQNEMNQRGAQLSNMQQQVIEVEKLRNENTILQASNESLHAQWAEAQDIIKNCTEQIKRLTATEMTPADWDKRAASLREPYLTQPFNAPELSADDAAAVDEIQWLERIEQNCKDYGISFPRRILWAFHTAFKISSWSTLTVLAGVSGTGKSELPHLYSAFGGFNFIGVPVQPNWDSQESMLGFFNSIDNKFDAQPVLKFLVECTEKYSNNMAIVLLDEMNLAHVEHYFADFLSKLEMRRSAPDDNLPKIYVNLGAGVKPYELPLTRNILWCGTMNQDETTKSLSDKVLDRGIVINFPRPTELKGRAAARNLDKFCQKIGVSPMSRQVWNKWRETRIKFEGKQLEKIDEYRLLLQDMNNYLSHAGRAIGHRVWQSIEHYVINYPDVRAELQKAGGELTGELDAAIHTAVEDQIVQKVMPKLRGIDTRGKSYENCLVHIKSLLGNAKFNLDSDFDKACEMGYGQFIWNSAEYIGD